MPVQLPLHKQFHPSSARASEGAPRPAESGAPEPRPVDAAGLSLRVGDLAKRTGKTVRALHLYEEHGLLAPTQRSSGGYRLYNRESELRVRWIDKLQQMGFSLPDIKQIVAHVEAGKSAPDAMHRVREIFREKLAETREQVRRLMALEGELTASVAYLETCDHCDTEELLSACAACARHDCEHKAPDLVAGFRVH
jgi:MerR family transcriptional regulator, copper efflux regulator